MTTSRRQFLTGAAAGAAAAVAGCSSGSGDTGMKYDGTTVEAPEAAAEYLSNVSNFEGEAADWTDRGEVTVTVGTAANGGNNGFGPAAITVSSGTTVVWEWNGKGMPHNVVAEDESFDSGAAVIEDGTTFSHTFEETGVHRYFCLPHKAQGMKGVVVVE
jgi:halocyanin-like protein